MFKIFVCLFLMSNYSFSRGWNIPVDPFPTDEDITKPKNVIDKVNPKNLKAINTNCKTQDYRSKLPPVRDQGSFGWCFGFTGADLLSFKTKKNISAMDLSLKYHYDKGNYKNLLSQLQQLPSNLLNGGRIEGALENISQKKVCLEDEMHSNDFDSAKAFAEFLRKKRQPLTKANSLQLSASVESSNNNTSEVANSQAYPSYSRTLSSANNSDSNSNIANYLSNLMCENPVQLPKINVKSIDYRGGNFLYKYLEKQNDYIKSPISEIQKQLNSGRIVGIGYNSGILDDPEMKVGGFNHASSIVGQRMNTKTGQCEFLLRNSWGRTCNYNKSYSCTSEGNVWIPAVNLGRSIYGVTYVE